MPPEGLYNPYPIVEVLDIEEELGQTLGEFVFSFTTDDNVKYLAIFNTAEHHFNEQCNFAFNVYEFSFLKGASEKNFNDIRIKDTIHWLLEYFMKEHGHSIFFICDEVDGRSAPRNRLFKRWLSYFGIANYQTYFAQYELQYYQPYVGIIALHEDIGFDEYIKYLEPI